MTSQAPNDFVLIKQTYQLPLLKDSLRNSCARLVVSQQYDVMLSYVTMIINLELCYKLISLTPDSALLSVYYLQKNVYVACAREETPVLLVNIKWYQCLGQFFQRSYQLQLIFLTSLEENLPIGFHKFLVKVLITGYIERQI